MALLLVDRCCAERSATDMPRWQYAGGRIEAVGRREANMRVVTGLLCAFALLASLIVDVAAQGVDDDRVSRRSYLAMKKERERATDDQRRRQTQDGDGSAARANEADPSGAYKSLPDWARAGLGTKPSGR
ncbi:MAG: hypothetical protein ABL904_15010 [Hyphomicrobiaceae bacterium]